MPCPVEDQLQGSVVDWYAFLVQRHFSSSEDLCQGRTREWNDQRNHSQRECPNAEHSRHGQQSEQTGHDGELETNQCPERKSGLCLSSRSTDGRVRVPRRSRRVTQ